MTTSVSVEVAAPAEVVWALVSDLSRMGEWSPETTGVRWLEGASGPSVGAKFRGSNRKGVRRWSTTCTIVAADPPRALAWDVTTVFGLEVAEWRYEIEPTGELTCRLTESMTDHRKGVTKLIGNLATGVTDRTDHNRAGMEATLARVKAAAEPNP